MKVVILNRISSSTQSLQSQSDDLNKYCDLMSWEVCGEFSYIISGKSKNEDREGLMKMFSFLSENKDIKKVVVWEISRLGRTISSINSNIDKLTDIGVSVHIKNFSIDTLKIDGSVDLIGKLMCGILSSLSELEINQIKGRLDRGRKSFVEKNLKEKGVSGLGRKIGSIKSDEKFLEENKDIIKCLKKGLSVRDTMSLTKKSSHSVQKVRKMIKKELLS